MDRGGYCYCCRLLRRVGGWELGFGWMVPPLALLTQRCGLRTDGQKKQHMESLRLCRPRLLIELYLVSGVIVAGTSNMSGGKSNYGGNINLVADDDGRRNEVEAVVSRRIMHRTDSTHSAAVRAWAPPRERCCPLSIYV